MVLLQALSAPALAFAAAVAAVPAFRLERPWRDVVFFGAEATVLLAPLLTPDGRPFLRFSSAILSVGLIAKLVDLNSSAEHSERFGIWTTIAFLPNLFSVCLRRLDAEPRPSARANVWRIVRSSAALAVAVPWFVFVFRLDMRCWPFCAEHVVKMLALFAVVLPVADLGASAWRLLGGRARDFMHAPYAARTPADFWKRYNRPAQQFFYEDIFLRCGGLHAPVRATLVTFAFSGVIHEYLFVIATGQLRGYQLAFFLLQGCAVAATWRVRPRGRRAVYWVLGTLAFNLASSVLFFTSINSVAPFYSRPLPSWLAFRL
jgi:hypothetical protein